MRNEDSTMRLSYKERMVDALAPEVDEGRGQRRYAPGRCKQPLIRGFLNGETLHGDKPWNVDVKSWAKAWEIASSKQPREVKHLSTWRKINRRDSLSSGERTGNSPNLSYDRGCRAHPD